VEEALGPAIDARAIADSPVAALEELAGSDAPWIIGVRHHSPAMASCVPALLDAAAPDVILLELPEELQRWLGWLGSAELEAPVALAAARADGRGLLFYPYADFSPELATVRWAARHSVAIEAFDLPLRLSVDEKPEERTQLAPSDATDLTEALQRHLGVDSGEEMWDRLIEVRAPGQEPEAVRRAALLTGWAMRTSQESQGGVPMLDLRREAWMRRRLAAVTSAGAKRPVAVVGAFHGPALLRGDEPASAGDAGKVEVVTSLIPYAFELLDSRSGYPAGIRDPEWQQSVWAAGGTAEAISESCTDFAVRITRELRGRGHPAGVPDSREVVRVAGDLSRLRQLPSAGRRELVEALQLCLAQGEPLGRGRAVARAMQSVLVGSRRGRLADGTPRSGLGPHVETLFEELAIPGPRNTEAVEVRWDPLRSDLDRRRHVAVQRLTASGVPYATPMGGANDQAPTLTVALRLYWGPATTAMLELAGVRGVTLEQAAEGALRHQLAGHETADVQLAVLAAAGECGLPRLVHEQLDALATKFVSAATLPQLIAAVDVVERLIRGHVPGYQPDEARAAEIGSQVVPVLIAAAVHQVEGLQGSDRIEDAQALLALVRHTQSDEPGAIGDTRIKWALARLATDGSPLMQGAAGALRVLLGHEPAHEFSERVGSWVDAASDRQSVEFLAKRLRGTLAMAAPLLEASSEVTAGLAARIGALNDDGFMRRLPALRDGFDVMSPAARQRFLDSLAAAMGGHRVDLRLEHSREELAIWTEADRRGRQAVELLDPEVLEWPKKG